MVPSSILVSMFDACCTCGSVRPGETGSWFLSYGLCPLTYPSADVGVDGERQAVTLLSKKRDPLSLLVRGQPALIPGGSPSPYDQ